MKKYLIALIAMFFAVTGSLHANTVSISDARNVALNFFKMNAGYSGTSMTATLKYTKSAPGAAADFYVFDIDPTNGFVIVSADDNVSPILAYSTTGHFRTDFDHVGVHHWINRTAANIRLAIQSNARADVRISSLWSAYRNGQNPSAQRGGSVSPLCSTTWDQENDTTGRPPFLYNLFCPYNAADAQRCLTGCEATAMGQIMKFWNYPAQGVGSFTYVDDTVHGYSGNYGTISSNFAAHTYQWQSMPNVLVGTEAPGQDTAVDQLLYDCAVSVGMDFGDDNQNGSAANGLLSYELQYYGDSFCVQYALVKYFGYDKDTIKGVIEANYTSTDWIALIEHELNMGRPVLYEGNDTTQGGHAWVCDGYDANNFFHMNWGWAGFDDGYFAINNFTTSGNFNPIQDEDALIGIMPKHGHSNGIGEVGNAIAFNIYPNPATNKVILQANDRGNSAEWSVQDIVGQTVISGKVGSALTHIDISGLSDGAYFVELMQGGKTTAKKLVISK